MTQKTHHEWSKEALFAKAQLYSESMAENADTEWKFGLWSAFTLEMLVRGSVAANSPALVGDTQDWSNILYGLAACRTFGLLAAGYARIMRAEATEVRHVPLHRHRP